MHYKICNYKKNQIFKKIDDILTFYDVKSVSKLDQGNIWPCQYPNDATG